MFFSILIILIILILLSVFSIKIIPQGYVGIVESFGKYNRTLNPGLHFILPIIYQLSRKVSLKQVPLEIEPQNVITKDNVKVTIDEAIKYRVTDIESFVYKNENSVKSMIQDCQSNLRGIIGKMDLNEVLNGTEEINESLFQSVQNITSGYGLSIDRINIGEISVDEKIEESMNKIMTANREKEASISAAEGQKQATILQSEARSQEMQIDAEARSKQTEIDAKARALRIKIDTEADAEKIAVLAKAEEDRIKTINKAIKESDLTNEALTYLGIEAFKEVVNSHTNTVILPSNMTELGNIPVAKELWDTTKTK